MDNKQKFKCWFQECRKMILATPDIKSIKEMIKLKFSSLDTFPKDDFLLLYEDAENGYMDLDDDSMLDDCLTNNIKICLLYTSPSPRDS